MKSVLVPNAPWPIAQVSLPVQQKKRLYGWRKAEILQENAKLEDFLCSEPRVNLSKLQAAKRYRDPVTGRFSNNED
jgi:hypothetical protein